MSEFDRRKWDRKYATTPAPLHPSAALLDLNQWLPAKGRALDVAGGGGRHALWLAQRGLDVTLCDVSAVALRTAARRAKNSGLHIDTLCRDVSCDSLPSGPWDLIVSVCFLDRRLLRECTRALRRNGRMVVIQPTRENLTKHARPPAEFLLHAGELPALLSPLKLRHYNEGWSADGRHDAIAVADCV